LCSELRAYALGWQNRTTAEACRLRTCHCPGGYFLPRLRLENLERHARRLAPGPLDPRLQRPSAVRLLAQPERAHQRDFCAAVRRLALHRACPEVGDGRRTVGIWRVQLGEFLFRLPLDLRSDAAQVCSELQPVVRDVLKQYLEDKIGDGVQVTGKRLAAEPQGCEGNRSTTSKGVHHQRWLLSVDCLYQPACDLQV